MLSKSYCIIMKKDFNDKSWEALEQGKKAIVMDLYNGGPDCAKFLSRRLKMPLGETMDLLNGLEDAGWLQRIKGTFLFKRGFKRPKHMNHTYYELSRPATLFLRGKMRKKGAK